MLSDRIGIVFVPGAGLGCWIWREMAPRLDVPSLAADFPGRGATNGSTDALTLDDYVHHVHGQMDDFRAERVVIVAHSLGGVIGLKLADRVSDRLVGFVGIGAAIPRPGGSFVSCLPLAKRVAIQVVMRAAGTKPPEAAIRSGLASDLDSDSADEVVRRFVAESRAVYLERVGVPAPAVPSFYVRLTRDRELGPSLQLKMARNLGEADVRDLTSGHLPMLSQPDQLAQIVNEFTSALGPGR